MEMSTSTWFVYIVRCNDNSFYTGVTTNLNRRINEHNTAKVGAKYTKSRRPVTMVYNESHPSRSEACKREYQIKQLSLKKKLELINSFST